MTAYQDPVCGYNLDNLSWLGFFPKLQALRDPLWEQIFLSARRAQIPARQHLFRDGDYCKNYILLIDGLVRVYKTSSSSGREISLCRVGNGETCALTTAMLLADKRYPAFGVAEVDSQVIYVPRDHFQKAFEQSANFRKFVCSEYGQSITEIISLLVDVAFGQIDTRLAYLLLQRSLPNTPIPVSHWELAIELGTAREVISRQLKDFEQQGWVELGRRKITVLDIDSLQKLVDSNT